MADTFTDAIESRVKGNPVFLPEGLDILKTFEGFEENAYYDQDKKAKKGKLTIGYGFTNFDIPGLKEGDTISRQRAEQLLPSLVNRKYGPELLKSVKVPLSDNQYTALTSFAYNVGPTAFKNSTLLKRLNSGDFNGASEEFGKWVKAGGQTREGLVRRRKAEKALFNNDITGLGQTLEEQKYGTPNQIMQKVKKSGGLSAISPMPDTPEGIEEAPSSENDLPFMEGVDFSGNVPTQYANSQGLNMPAGLNPIVRG